MALHLKLDELIRATDAARNDLLDLDELSQEELDALRAKYQELAHAAPPEQPSRIQQAIEAEHQRRSARPWRPS